MSTSEPHPLYNALRGTLLFEVNFTDRGYPLQKCLRGRFDNLVKFTFRDDPRQNAFRGTLTFEVNFTTLPPKSTQPRMVIILMRSAKVGEMRQGSLPRLERCDKAVTQPPHNHQAPKSPALQAKRCYRPLAHIAKPGFHAEKGERSSIGRNRNRLTIPPEYLPPLSGCKYNRAQENYHYILC